MHPPTEKIAHHVDCPLTDMQIKVKNCLECFSINKGRCKKHTEGGTLFRAAFRCICPTPFFGFTYIHHPHFWLSSGAPHFRWTSRVPPISENIFFFKKCACVLRHFYITQKGMMLLSQLSLNIYLYIYIQAIIQSKLVCAKFASMDNKIT